MIQTIFQSENLFMESVLFLFSLIAIVIACILYISFSLKEVRFRNIYFIFIIAQSVYLFARLWFEFQLTILAIAIGVQHLVAYIAAFYTIKHKRRKQVQKSY